MSVHWLDGTEVHLGIPGEPGQPQNFESRGVLTGLNPSCGFCRLGDGGSHAQAQPG